MLYTGTIITTMKERTNHQTNLHIQDVSMTNKAKGRKSSVSKGQIYLTSDIAGPHIEVRTKFTLVFIHI